MQVSVEIDKELLEQAMLLSQAQNVSELLQQALQTLVHTSSKSTEISARQALLAEMLAIAERCAALPDIDTRPESEILGYNAQGLLTHGD
ncbi:MAG: type II toxin-antitoxin system VapB family antitoxin [Thioploca sp.]|nr:type II toxin-antitoxin system VapB family antitoxin [Thioploca sp.]